MWLTLLLLVSGCASGSDQTRPDPDAGDSQATPGVETQRPATDSDQLPEWTSIASLETPRDDFGTAVVGSRIWAMGGMYGQRGNRLVSIEVLDTRTGQWETSDIEMPVGLASFEIVARGRSIYAFGGFDADAVATRFSSVLDTATGSWRRMPPLPHARYAHTVTEYDGRFYVIGGRDADGIVEEVDVFEPRSRTWTTLDQPMASARDSHETVATPSGLVVVGGFLDYEDRPLVDLLDPASGKWSSLPALPEPMSRAGLAYADGMLWVTLHESAYVLDLADPGAGWEPANPLTISRHGMGFEVVDGVIYSIGGCALDPLRDVRTVDRLELV